MTTQQPATIAVHVTAPDLPHSRSISVPIYQASNFAFDDPDALADALERPDGEFVYSRYANPTIRALETTVATLEGGPPPSPPRPAWARSTRCCCRSCSPATM